MSFGRIGMDFLGGGMEGAGAGAMTAAGLKMAGATVAPYAIPLVAGMAGVGALTRILGGLADKPAERMHMRLGSQQVALNDLEIEARRRAGNEERRALMKNRKLQDVISGIFGSYGKAGA
jgi:hypothetical protein